MIVPAAVLAATLAQASLTCDWSERPNVRLYVCSPAGNISAAIAFVCDGKTRAIARINFAILRKEQGVSGRMRLKNGSTEVQIPMLAVPSGLNGFVSAAVPEAFDAAVRLLENAKGALSFEAIDADGVAVVNVDGNLVADAFKTARTGCAGA